MGLLRKAVAVAMAMAVIGTAAAAANSSAPTNATVASAPAGVYDITAKVVGTANGRVAITVAGDRVAEFTTTGETQTLQAAAYVRPGETVATVAIPGPGSSAPAPMTASAPTLVAAPAGYTVRGKGIVDPSGNRFTPRGVNREGLEAFPKGYYVNTANGSQLYGWGSTMVRVQLGEQFWLSTSCQYDPTYADRVDQEINSITQFGVMALVDLHWNTRNETCGAADQQKMADAQAVTFWKQVAGRYANNPLVAFDLYNEPHDVTPAVWRDGGTVDGWQAAGMQQLYDAVRSTGARNLVLVSGLKWGLDLRSALTNPLDGYGIVFGTHLYCDACGGTIFPDASSWVLPIAQQHPVVVSEFGDRSGTGSWNKAVIDWAEQNGMGWLAFNWNACPATDPVGYCLLDSWSTYQPNASGRPVRDALWAARGWHSPWGYWG